MRFARVVISLAFGLCLAPPAPGALLGATSASDDVDRLVLIDGKTVNGWQAVESTLTPAVIAGTNALLFSVPVNWKTGEPEYPIGWPRIQMSVPAEIGDWRTWEQMRLRLYALTDGDPLPYRPLGVTISGDDRALSWGREAEGLEAGQWREFAFDLRQVPALDRVRSIGIYISEDGYRDGAQLRFYIAELELLRYRRPTLVGMRPIASVAFVDSEALPLEVTMLGLAEGATGTITFRLMRDDKSVARAEARAAQGTTQASLALPRGLPPGEYAVVASSGGRELRHAIRLAASPWKEKAQ